MESPRTGLLLGLWLCTLTGAITAQKIETGGPYVNQPLKITYTSEADRNYTMFIAQPPLAATTIQGIAGTLHLNPALLLGGYAARVPSTGVDSQVIPIPNEPILVGVRFALQTLDAAPNAAFTFSNAVTLAFRPAPVWFAAGPRIEGSYTATAIFDADGDDWPDIGLGDVTGSNRVCVALNRKSGSSRTFTLRTQDIVPGGSKLRHRANGVGLHDLDNVVVRSRRGRTVTRKALGVDRVHAIALDP